MQTVLPSARQPRASAAIGRSAKVLRHTVIPSAVLALVALLATGSSGASQRLGLELGNLGGTASAASAINDSGQVVGWAETRKSRNHAFVWSRGKMIDLGTLGGPASAAFGVNTSGQAVGSSWLRGGSRYDAFLWSKGRMLDLGTLAPDDPEADSEAYAVNDAGQVVGWSDTDFGDLASHAFLWSAGRLADLGTLGSDDLDSTAYDINNAGQVVGASDIGGGEHRHAFLRTNGGKMSDLGTLGAYSESSAVAINDSGQIVGSSYTRSSGKITTERAFLWSSGTMTDLGTLGGKSSVAGDINSSGQVVGASQTSSGRWHAFVWSRGKMTDLGTLGARGGSASGLNTSGDIVGAIQWDAKGRDAHAVLWTAANKVGRTTVPNLRGVTLTAAHDAIARAECSFGRLRRAYSNRTKAGRVVLQSPRAGARVTWGTKINIVISRGARG